MEGITLITVNGRTYRKAPVKKSTKTSVVPSRPSDEGKMSHPLFRSFSNKSKDDFCEEEQLDIIKDEVTSTYTLKLPLSNVFFKFLIGKKSATKLRIQNETGATLIIPRPTELQKDEIGSRCDLFLTI
jgi:hypothetical protein